MFLLLQPLQGAAGGFKHTSAAWHRASVRARPHAVACTGSSATAELDPPRLLWVSSKSLQMWLQTPRNVPSCVSHTKLHPCKLVEDAGALFALAAVSPLKWECGSPCAVSLPFLRARGQVSLVICEKCVLLKLKISVT